MAFINSAAIRQLLTKLNVIDESDKNIDSELELKILCKEANAARLRILNSSAFVVLTNDRIEKINFDVIPAKAGIQKCLKILDFHFRRNDGN